jgi:hypothetical protein
MSPSHAIVARAQHSNGTYLMSRVAEPTASRMRKDYIQTPRARSETQTVTRSAASAYYTSDVTVRQVKDVWQCRAGVCAAFATDP